MIQKTIQPKAPSVEEKSLEDEIINRAGKRTVQEVRRLVLEVIGILEDERRTGRSGKLEVEGKMVRLPPEGEAIFVGDLHGSIADLRTILNSTKFVERAAKGDDIYLVFLGDYVDRNPNSEEVLETVLELKRLFPGNVVLLRGNHEDPRINAAYDFLSELEQRGMGDLLEGERGRPYARLYASLPLIAVSPNGVVALHGGVPRGVKDISDLKNIPDIESPYLHMMDSEERKKLVDLLWSDPREWTEGFCDNRTRGIGDFFGKKALQEFLKMFGGNVLVRGHEAVTDGFKVNFADEDGKPMCVTVFSTNKGVYEYIVRAAYVTVDLAAADARDGMKVVEFS